MKTQPYIVNPSTSPFLRNLTFFKTVVILVNLSTGKKYGRHSLVKNELPVPPTADWQVEERTISGSFVKRVNGGQPIDSLVDEHGNIFYDVTEDL